MPTRKKAPRPMPERLFFIVNAKGAYEAVEASSREQADGWARKDDQLFGPQYSPHTAVEYQRVDKAAKPKGGK